MVFRPAQIVRFFYNGTGKADYVLAVVLRNNRKTVSIRSLEPLKRTGGRSKPSGYRWRCGRRLLAEATEAEVMHGRKMMVTLPDDDSPEVEYPAKVGMRMQFTTRTGETVIGTVTRVNQKTVSLQPDDTENWWRVPPENLRPVTN